MQQNYRFVLGLIVETTPLVLLWYVMCRQGKTWAEIGWKLELADIPRGLGVYAVARVVEFFVWNLVQYICFSSSGHWLVPKSLNSVSFGISFFSVAYVCLAPFFEELIVRAYTMSEIMGLSNSAGLAIVLSVALQMSYHLYQGLANCIMLTAVFTVYSVYFARTRRIVPIVMAHLLMDLMFLTRRSF
jgi:membrane protease YdiL (CAAX protease family)